MLWRRLKVVGRRQRFIRATGHTVFTVVGHTRLLPDVRSSRNITNYFPRRTGIRIEEMQIAVLKPTEAQREKRKGNFTEKTTVADMALVVEPIRLPPLAL